MNTIKTGFSLGFLVLACTMASAAYASSPQVVAMHATFISQANSSGQDPHVNIKIYNNKHELVAENDGIPGHWGNKDINSISLDLKKPFDASDIASGKVELDIHPDGKDNWAFNYNIATTYSDDTVVWQRWKGKDLSQDKATLSDTLKGQ